MMPIVHSKFRPFLLWFDHPAGRRHPVLLDQGSIPRLLAEPALATVMVRLPSTSMIADAEVESYTRSAWGSM